MNIGSIRFYLLTGMLLFIGQLLTAQQSQPVYLWKLEADHFDQPSYLLAVLHSTDASVFPAEEVITPYMQQCVEYASVWPSDARGKNQLIGYMQTANGKALKKTLGKTGYNTVEYLVRERLETDLIYYQNWQPTYLRKVLLDRGLKSGNRQLSGEYLYQLSKTLELKNGLIIQPDILGLLSGQVSYETQAQILLDYANHPAQYEKLLMAMKTDFLSADFAAIRNVSAIVEPPEFNDKMIATLNGTLGVRISELAMKRPTFFSVEAQHFGGNGNLLEKLTELGISVTPVTDFDLPVMQPVTSTTQTTQVDPVVPEFSESETITAPGDGAGTAGTTSTIETIETAETGETSPVISTSNDLAAAAATTAFDYFTYRVDSSLLSFWVPVSAEMQDFVAYMPAVPRFNATSFEGDDGRVEMQYYALNDTLTGLYYIISRNTYPPGFEVKNEARFFDKNLKSVLKQFSGEVVAKEEISGSNFTARRFVVGLDNGEMLRSGLYLSGNRLYQVAVMGGRNNIYAESPNTFLGSFDLFSESKNWSSINGKGFTAKMPLQPVSKNGRVNSPDGDILVEHYNVNVPGTGLLYSLYVNRYPDPFRAGGMTGYYDRLSRQTLLNLRAYNDKEESVKKGKIKGRYVEATAANKAYKIYFFLHKKTLYQLMVSGTPQQLQSADMNYFVNSLELQLN